MGPLPVRTGIGRRGAVVPEGGKHEPVDDGGESDPLLGVSFTRLCGMVNAGPAAHTVG